MRKMLPISNPLIECYPQHAFYMSIISEKEECLPWIFSNYSNLFMNNRGFCDFFVKTPEYYHYPWFYGSQRLHRNFLINNKIEFIIFIKESIIDNNYIWLYIDEFYLSCSANFGKEHYIHSIMISGFDDLNQTFLVHGYYDDAKYATKYVDYNDMEFSFYNADPKIYFEVYIHLLKYNENYSLNNFTYNVELLKQQLMSHLNSDFAPLLNPEEIYNLRIRENLATGLNVYDKLIEFYNLETTFHDHRPLYVLVEHIKFMILKLNYLKSKNILVFSEEVFKKYESLQKSIEKQLFLYIKYSLVKNEDILMRIKRGLLVVRNEEKEVLELMLSEF